MATENSAAISQSFPPEVVNLITKDFRFEDRYAARLVNEFFSKMIPAPDPYLIEVLVDRMWNCPDHVSMQRQAELDDSWMEKSDDMFACINCVELLHESKFDEANKTGRKRRGVPDSWYRTCNQSWCPEDNAYRGGQI